MKKFLPIAIAILLIAATSLCSSFKAHAAESTGMGIIQNIKVANVYKGPDKSYGITGGKVKEGELIKIYLTRGEWTYFQSNNDYGWIATKFVKTASGIGIFTDTKSSYSRYKGPGVSYGKNGSVKPGTLAILFEKVNGYRHLFVNGQEAWVLDSYLENTYGVAKIKVSSANLYKGPGTKYGISRKLSKNTTVTYAEANNGWRQVFVAGKSYWVRDTNLAKSSYSAPTHQTIVAKNYANLYKGPVQSSGTYGKATNGKAAVSFSTMGNWTFVQTSNQQGWAWTEYLEDTVSTGKITGVKKYANIYKSAKQSGGVTGATLKNHTTVAIMEAKNGWRHVRSSKTSGWVSTKYIKNEMSLSSGHKGSSTTSASIKVYLMPSTSLGSIASLPKGSTVTLFEKKGDWRYVQSGHLQGWINAGAVSKNSTMSGINVILDPGHGGTDPGAVGNGLKEADLTLDISRRAKVLFDKTPIHTIMTRTSARSSVTANTSTTTSSSLVKRMQFAAANKQSKKDVFVSIHINSGGGTGGETYYYGAQAVNPYRSDSRLLAQKIQARLIEYMDYTNRGTKSANFYVLKFNSMPAALMEAGFIDTKKDAAKLKKDYWKQQAAKAVYQGTLDYYRAKGYNVGSFDL